MNLASFRDFLVLFELCTFLQNEVFESQRKQLHNLSSHALEPESLT